MEWIQAVTIPTPASGPGRSSATPLPLPPDYRSTQTLLPVGVPIAVGNRIVFRGAAVSAPSMPTRVKEVWRADPGLSLEGVLGNAGQKVQIEDWRSKYAATNSQAALVQNAALGTLSSDGRHVYAVEDLPLPPPPQMIVEQQSGQPRHFGPLRDLIHHNRLRALDLTTGAVVWEIGGRAGAVPAELADVYFLGPPLPLAGSLYALGEKQSDCVSSASAADTGAVLWTQTLATVRTKLLLDVPRRLHAVHLAFRAGVLVCPTNTGVILGVDPLSRSLLWRTPTATSRPTPRKASRGTSRRRPFSGVSRIRLPIIVGDRVVYAGPDSDSIRCLNLRDGSLLWKVARAEEDRYVGGVRDGKVLVVGRLVCRALSLDKGEVLWQQATPEPSGLGVFCGKHFYLPLRDKGVLLLDLDRPAEAQRLDCRGGETPGNLVFHAGDLWSQDDLGISAYPQLATKLAQIDDVLKRRRIICRPGWSAASCCWRRATPRRRSSKSAPSWPRRGRRTRRIAPGPRCSRR